jgi:hypothetical protein
LEVRQHLLPVGHGQPQVGDIVKIIRLRRRFPGITDNVKARDCARAIAGWTPLPKPPAKMVRLRPSKRRP